MVYSLPLHFFYILCFMYLVAAYIFWRERKLFNGVGFLIAAVFAEAICEFMRVVYLSVSIPETAISLFMLIWNLRGLSALCLLFFAIKFTGLFFKISKSIILLLLTFPAVALAVSLTNNYHGLMFKYIELISIYPEKKLVFELGIWNYGYMALIFVSYIASVIIFIKKFFTVPFEYKLRPALLTVAYALMTAVFITGVFGENMNVDSPIYLPAFFIIYWALIKCSESDLRVFAKSAIFNKLSCAVLVLENDGKIVEMNDRAMNILALGKNMSGSIIYDDFIDELIKQRNGEVQTNEFESIIMTVESGKISYYQEEKSEICDSHNKKIGVFVELHDVTKQQELIHELYRLVNYDQLTNCYNRRYFDQMLERYDDNVHLPLAIVSGDLNSLKYVNDTYGHSIGDKLIVRSSEILRQFAGQDDIVSRQGGDEFFVLMPNKGEREVLQYIENVEKLCMEENNTIYGKISISLGYSIKTDKNQDIKGVMLDADLAMYQRKRQCRLVDSRERSGIG